METIDAEYYFIQLLFCMNRELLRKDYREIYDAMFTQYDKIYTEGRLAGVDLKDINDKFLAKFKGKKK